MDSIWLITFIGFASGVIGTGLGGVLGSFFRAHTRRGISFALEFTGGLMLAVVCFDLLPEAFGQAGLFLAVCGIFLGVLTVILLQNLIYKNKKLDSSQPLLKSGLFIAIGMALHNFPEGLAIGSGFSISQVIGFSIFSVIALHDVVEGACVTLPIRAGGKGPLYAVGAACLSGVPTGFGALIGAAAGAVNPGVTALCLSFAAGAMLYIVCGDIFVQSKKMYPGRLPAVGNILGFVVGMVLTLLITGAV